MMTNKPNNEGDVSIFVSANESKIAQNLAQDKEISELITKTGFKIIFFEAKTFSKNCLKKNSLLICFPTIKNEKERLLVMGLFKSAIEQAKIIGAEVVASPYNTHGFFNADNLFENIKISLIYSIKKKAGIVELN